MYVEKKLEVNAKKVAFAKAFPGRLHRWEEASGKTIEHVIAIHPKKDKPKKNGVVIFTDATFIFVPSPEVQPALLIQSLFAAQPFLMPHYATDYEQLEQLIAEDKEMQRLARLENIMGAIRNNFPQIPELKTALEGFLKKH